MGSSVNFISTTSILQKNPTNQFTILKPPIPTNNVSEQLKVRVSHDFEAFCVMLGRASRLRQIFCLFYSMGQLVKIRKITNAESSKRNKQGKGNSTRLDIRILMVRCRVFWVYLKNKYFPILEPRNTLIHVAPKY